MVEVPEVRFVVDGDLSLAYFDLAGGPEEVVIVNGLVSHLEQNFAMFPDFGRMINRLNGFARVVAFDKRGCGMSDRIAGVPSLEERTADIDIILDAVGLDRVTLIGFSEGASIAALYAATKPERVARLVLGGGYAKFLTGDDYLDGITDEEMTHLLGAYCDEWGTGVSADRYQPGPVSVEDRRRWAGFERSCCTPSTMRQLFTLMSDLDVRTALPSISCPTLVISERDDRPQGGRYLAEQIPNARLRLLDGSVHLPWHGTERFDEWMDGIEEFITGTTVGAVDLDRVLAAVVFIDIVDSTVMASSMGDTRWRVTLDRYEQSAAELATRFGGRVVKATGDGSLATFDGPARAVRFAAAIIDTAATQLGIEVRAGVHVGEVEQRGDDIGGISVHIAARVEAAAAASEVLVSSMVEQLCLGSGLNFEPVGTHTLKGVPGEWELKRLTNKPT